jgi:serine/threonine-protein kinase
VHRDVKPENLFVTSIGGEHDVVKVLDFGIAKSLAEASGLTSDGALVGTPRFMALEQAIGEPVTPRTDVYALGAVLYFALVGAPPIDEPTVFAVIAAHAAETILPPSARDPSVPASLDAIVMRCLAGKPEARFADAGELARALEATGLPAAWRPERAEALRASDAGPPSVSRARLRAELADAPTKVQRG